MVDFKWFELPPRPKQEKRGKLIAKVPMNQVYVTEDGQIWMTDVVKGKLEWIPTGRFTFIDRDE